MGWPTMSDYQEVVQNPRNCFSDAQLQAGSPTLNPLGLPQPVTGGFASVYQISSGKTRWAVRCFLHRIPDLQERYALISHYLKSRSVRSMVGFEYLAEGIRVRGEWYPVLKMEWVEGNTLNVFIEKNLQSPKTLLKTAGRWLDLVGALEKAGVSHCDLQHGNVMATGGDIKLIDYDGMYVPALKGRGSHEKGHAAYQHPRREGKDFNEEIDRFPALVIYLSLVAVARSPDLWKRFYEDDNLLFRRSDFLQPDQAPVFQALEALPDTTVVQLAQTLHECCKRPLSDTPRLREVVEGRGAAPPALPAASQPPRPSSPPPQAPPAPRPAAIPVVVARAVSSGRPAAAPAGARAGGGGHSSGAAVAVLAPRAAPAAQASRAAPRPTSPGWTIQWVRPGQVKERHVFKSPVYGTRRVPSRFLGLIPSTRTEKFIERYEDHVELRNSTVDGHYSAITSLAFSPDGRSLASSSQDRTVRVWTVSTGQEACGLLEAKARIMAMEFVPGRSAVAMALQDRRLVLWDYGLQREVIHLDSPDGSRLLAVAVSGDGRWVAAGGTGRSVFVWQADRGHPARTFRRLRGKVEALAFTPDGGSIICATSKRRIHLLDCASGNTVWTVKSHLGPIAVLAALPRGSSLVTASLDGTVAFLDLHSGREERRLVLDSRGGIRSLAVSAEGSLAAGLADRTARVYEASSAREVARLEGHRGAVNAVAVSASLKVATGSRDGSLRLWTRA